jgi:anti-sigma B factor antagonist
MSGAEIRTLDVDGVRVVALVGEHDLTSTAELADAIENGGARVIVDLVQADFIDSTVIRSLLSGHHQAQDGHDRSFAIAVKPGSFADRVLELVELPNVVPTYPTREQAVAALRSSRP